MPGAPDPLYVRPRSALLDVLEALEPHLDAVVLVGAQAVYVHTGKADVGGAARPTGRHPRPRAGSIRSWTMVWPGGWIRAGSIHREYSGRWRLPSLLLWHRSARSDPRWSGRSSCGSAAPDETGCASYDEMESPQSTATDRAAHNAVMVAG